VYSLTGWSIQRREFNRREDRLRCDELNSDAIAKLRIERDRLSPLGVFTLRDGVWPMPIVESAEPAVPCDVLTLELDAPRRLVQITVKGRQSFALGLRDGKVVAVDGPKSGSTTFELRALEIDTVIFYAISPGFVRVCVNLPVEDEDREWADVPFIVKNLQLPLRELIPALDTPAKEFAEAKSRLLAGESLDEEEFRRLTGALRPGVGSANPPRPIDQVLLMREEPDADYEELIALDPIRVLLSHPKWRRVLGFGWFDNDASLVQGNTYEYRITASFPVQDIEDTVYGFHTVPSSTLLPSEFLLHDLRFRLPEPAAVERAPGTPTTGPIQISRRGMALRPRQNPLWAFIPSLDDNSLVIDFPTPVTSVVLELQAGHDLRFTGHGFGLTIGPATVPPGERPRLTFPFSVRQLRLEGTAFLFAVRLPSGLEGLRPRSVILPPVLLKDSPRPQPPVSASIRNLQEAQPAPGPDDTPPAIPAQRPALGFEVKWRPALREGVDLWPQDADAAPPLDAALFQIEHREESPLPMMSGLVADPQLASSLLRGAALNAERLATVTRGALPYGHREPLIRALADGDHATAGRLMFSALSDWQPVLPEENWTLGNRSGSAQSVQIRIHPGANVMSVFPEVPRPGNGESLDLVWADVFDFEDGGNPVVRPLPQPGTHHRYRVRAIDPIGRPSLTWTETNVLRLEKHVPPPVPAGPDLTPASTLPLPRPSGVQAKVIVKDAPGLTPEDVTLLGADDNAIVLRWGWHTDQRQQDPFATEFRVYATDKPLDAIGGTLTASTNVGLGLYDVTIQLDRPVVAGAAKDAALEAGYPFVIQSHTAGQNITATVSTRVPGPNGELNEPALGPVRLYTHLTPDLTRPPTWAARLQVLLITAATQYEAVFRNRLTLTPDHARDSIWVGVSAADDQSYVPDQLSPAETRPGNESAIVPVVCEARYQGRPDFAVPPPLDPVPVLMTAEPADRAIQFGLNLTPYLTASGLTTGDRIRPERASAAAVFAAYRLSVTNQIIANAINPRPGEADVEVTVPNPGDRAAIATALNGSSVDALDDRFVVFLAGSHPYADRLFEPVTRQAVPFGEFQEALPPVGERYVYRVRRSDAAGHLSAGGAMAAFVLRVPAMTTRPSPVLVRRVPTDPPELMRLRVGPDPFVMHLLTFHQVMPNGARPAGEGTIVRIPNLADPNPAAGIRLRAPDGTLLPPQVKSLADADVIVDADGFRDVQLTFTAAPSERVQVWACAVSRDGVPSLTGGPWGLAMPPAPLPVPALTAAAVGPQVVFAWTWPAGDHAGLEVAIERSVDGLSWRRLSPVLGDAATSYVFTATSAASAQYRIAVMSISGRKAFGVPVTVT
jgi:hypothetical protein